MNIFSTWDLLKNPESKQKLGYAIAFFCIIAALVSLICGIVGWVQENEKFDYDKEKNSAYAEKYSECRRILPPKCIERPQSSFNCENLPGKWCVPIIGWCLADSDEKKECFDEKAREPGRAKVCLQEHYSQCAREANLYAIVRADDLKKRANDSSLDAGMDKGFFVARYFIIVIVAVLVFVFIAWPLIKAGGILTIMGTKATNRIIQDKVQYGDGFDYQAYKLLLALQIKILDEVGPISDPQMAVIQEQYDACGYKSKKFHGRFTKLQSSNDDLDFCIKSVRKAIVGHDELKLNVVEYLLAFAVACGYDENVERSIRYVSDNLGLSKDVYTVIRDSMLKNAGQANDADLEDFYSDFERNGVFSADEILQLCKMDLNERMPPMEKPYFREFFRFVFPLLVKQSYADGTLNEYRISVLKKFYSDCGYAECVFLRSLKANFADGHDIQFHVMALKQSTDRKKEFRIYALENMMLYASQCGELPRQFDMIERVANELDVSENTYETLKNKFAPQSGGLGIAIENLQSANKFHFV